MRPQYLKLRNFKSIGADVQSIHLAPITLLFGQNSAGKSTVLQALIYLREALVDRNYDADKTQLGGDWLDLGGFRNLVHNRKYVDDAIELEIGFSLDGGTLPDFLSDHERDEIEAAGFELPETWLGRVDSASIKLSVRWTDSRGKAGYPYVDSYSISINNEPFARISSSADGKQVFMEMLNLAHTVLTMPEADGVDPDDLSFQQRFMSLVSPTATTRDTKSIGSLLASDKPFADKSLDEIEDLVHGAAKGQPHLLKKLDEELSGRVSRRAGVLRKQIKREFEQSASEPSLGYLGLVAQPDALPHANQSLTFETSIWSDIDEAEGYEDGLFRLLAEALISGLTVGPLQKLVNWMGDLTYIGPLRDLPGRNLVPSRTPDGSRWARGLAAWELLHQLSEHKINEINFWLGDNCLKTGYQIFVKRYRELPSDSPLFTYLDREMELDEQLTLKELVEELPVKTRVTLRDQVNGDLEVMAQDIGVGISQLVPVVVLTVTQESGLLAIEQPELHIHPAIQVELADLFARYAIDHNKIMLLETHSEHVMLRLLRRIRERPDSSVEISVNRLEKDDVSVHYVQHTAGGTTFEPLKIDADGDFLDEWPDGFFDERDEELF